MTVKFIITMTAWDGEVLGRQEANARELSETLRQLADGPHALRPGDAYTIERTE
jgi:hypothetical protein